jgi:N-ethylmaleimide reductase
MAKLLTPLNIGALDLCHRAVFPGTEVGSPGELHDPPLPSACARQASPGGLVISRALAVRRAGRLRPGVAGPRDAPPWTAAVAAVHEAGGFILAQLAPGAPAEAPGRPLDLPRAAALLADYRRAAQDARHAGFDGVEVNAAGGGLLDFLPRGGPIAFLLDVLDALIADWAADRVGLRLSPHRAWRGGRDAAPLDLSEAVLRAVNEREVAYVHLAGAGACPGPGLYGEAGARRLREAIAWPLLASGPFSPLAGLTAVETRWADAVGFDGAEDAVALLAALRAAGGAD